MLRSRTFRIAIIFLLILSLLSGSFIFIYTRQQPARFEFFISGFDAFGNEKWIVDKSTGISASFENNTGLFYDSFSVRFSSFKGSYYNQEQNRYQWIGEFFCEPDNVIILNDNGKYTSSYLSYLNWKKDFYISEDKTFARVSVERKSDSGVQHGIVPEEFLPSTIDPKLDIRIDNSINAGQNYVEVTVYITNRYDHPVSLNYIYQDAVVMNFIQNANNGVYPLNFTIGQSQDVANLYRSFSNNNELHFAGSYRDNYNIVSGLYTNNVNSIVGNAPYYLGIKNSLSNVDGGWAIVQDDQENLRKTLDKVLTDQPAKKESDSSLSNRYILFPINDLKPGQQVVLKYYMIMADESDQSKDQLTYKNWSKKLEEIIKGIK